MTLHATDHLARTVEFQAARIHLTGDYAGMIEVPIFVGSTGAFCCDIDELTLRVEGEANRLRPAGQEYFAGQLKLTYFSHAIRASGKLPAAVQIQWGESAEEDSFGMQLLFQEASHVSWR